jgi:preprotein translocase subunit SecG
MLFTFLLIVQTLVAASLVAVILMQRSEGGGLVASSGGSLMTARGAADFLTRATAVLGTLFVVLSIALAGVATMERAPAEIDASLARQKSGPATPAAPFGTPAAPITGTPPSPNNDPLAGAAEQAAGQGAPAPAAAPIPGVAPLPANGAAPKQ